jgi:CHAT domain-containing protein
LRRLSLTGELARYRLVHFATHGAVAGETGAVEPGLVLTPPAIPSEEDDGYLAASEVAQLRLDAALVVLSACNTAAGGEMGADALSGLASAFFYAGARSLLVSHWAVESDAAVRLMTTALPEAARNGVRPSEALRRAMLDLIDTGVDHPARWAPFVIVGAD